MSGTSEEAGKKKGFWATILESMTKTGGCCGGGGNCCGSSQPKAEKKERDGKADAQASR